MDELTSVPAEPRSATEQLLEDSWETRERTGASRRELTVEATAAALFGVAAVVLLVPPGCRRTGTPASSRCSWWPTRSSRGSSSPSAPGTSCRRSSRSSRCSCSCRRLWCRSPCAPRSWPRPRRLGAGPRGAAAHPGQRARRLARAGTRRGARHRRPAHIGIAELPIMGVAFAACCVVDLLVSLTRGWLIGLVPDLNVQIRVIMTVWAVDASLAPLGFLAAIRAATSCQRALRASARRPAVGSGAGPQRPHSAGPRPTQARRAGARPPAVGCPAARRRVRRQARTRRAARDSPAWLGRGARRRRRPAGASGVPACASSSAASGGWTPGARGPRRRCRGDSSRRAGDCMLHPVRIPCGPHEVTGTFASPGPAAASTPTRWP